jgi:hypothetical protein
MAMEAALAGCFAGLHVAGIDLPPPRALATLAVPPSPAGRSLPELERDRADGPTH